MVYISFLVYTQEHFDPRMRQLTELPWLDLQRNPINRAASTQQGYVDAAHLALTRERRLARGGKGNRHSCVGTKAVELGHEREATRPQLGSHSPRRSVPAV